MTQLGMPPGGVTSQRTSRAGLIRARRPLPNGRAILGGFLVTAAAVGVFAAYTAAAAGPSGRYAVAARNLGPGDRIDASALRLVPLDLPDEQRRRSYDAIAPLLEATVVEPLLVGELIQEGSLVSTGATAGSRVVSFAVDAARAVNAALRPGESVDILATFGSGVDACTYLVATDVPIVTVAEATGSLVSQGGLTVTVEVSSAEEGMAVAHASNAGALTLIRTTHAAAADAARFCTPLSAEIDLEADAG